MSQDDDDEQKTNWQKDIILWNIGKLTWGFVASSAHVCTNMIRAFWKFSSTWRMALVVAMASTSALPHPWWYILLPLSWQQVNYHLPKSSAQSTDLSMKMQPWISMFKPSRSMSWCQWRFGFDTKFSNSQPQHKWVSKSLELLLLHMLQQTTSHRDSIKRRSKWVLSISNGNNWNSLAHNRFIHQETFWGEKKMAILGWTKETETTFTYKMTQFSTSTQLSLQEFRTNSTPLATANNITTGILSKEDPSGSFN
jgi:hypothetical protein